MRIVSINLCTDQILLDLDPGERLAAVSALARDREISSGWLRAHDIAATPASLEHVLAFDPDLVVAGSFGHTRLLRQVEGLGIRVLRVPEASGFEDIRAAYRLVGEAAGLADRAAAMVAAFDEALEGARPRRGETALLLSPGMLGHSEAMLGGAVLRHAGYANAHAGGAYLSLEALAAVPPEFVFVAAGDKPPPSRAVRMLAHPAVTDLDIRRIAPAPLLCGSLATARLAQELARDRAPQIRVYPQTRAHSQKEPAAEEVRP